jgi:hypothetical protein
MDRKGRKRMWKVVPLAIIVALSSACGARAADLYISPSGSDADPCSQAKPCRTTARGYLAAKPGQTVEMATGAYGDSDIPDDPSKTSDAVVRFVPAPGAAVDAGWLSVYGDHVELSGIRVSGWAMREGADDITLRDVDADEEGWWIRSASNVRILGGDLGPLQDYSSEVSAAWESSTPARNILFDGVTFHDVIKVTPGAHTDCLTVGDVDGLVIRNSRFRNCEHFDVIFGNDVSTGRAARNVILENNFFDCCRSGYYSVGFGAFEGGVVRHNSANLGFGFLGGDVSNLEIHSNILPSVQEAVCDKARWHHNVIASGARCGTGDRIAPSGFVDSGRFDFHLRPGAAAIGAGDPASSVRDDIDGGVRSDGRPDAGADEYGSAGGGGDPQPAGGGAAPTGSNPAQEARRPLVRGPGSWERRAGGPRPTLTIERRTVKRLRRGLRVKVGCPGGCRVRARLELRGRRAHRLRVSGATARAAGRATRKRPARLRLRLSRRAVRRLSGAGAVSGRLRVVASDGAGRARIALVLHFIR